MATEPQAANTPAPTPGAGGEPANIQPTMIPPTRVEVDPQSTQEQPPAPAPKPDPNRPAGLPEKFKSWEDMAKAYGELEKKLGTPKPEAPKGDDKGKAKDDLTIEAAEKLAESKGIDLAPFQNEFATEGKLSDKSYEALATKGIPKEMVDGFIAGQQALAERTLDEMTAPVGGREGYAKLSQWATQNVPANELEAYNKIVSGTDKAAAKIALEGLHARFKAAQEPNLFRAGTERAAEGDVYRSTEQMVADMNDPRYSRDPAFRQAVMEKLGRSNIL